MRLGLCKFRDETYEIREWNMEFMGDLVSIDTETEIAPFTQTPKISTFQAFSGDVVYYVPISKIALFLNRHSDSILLAQNMPFDCDVIHKSTNSRMMYDWYDKDLIRDTGVLYRLLHLASTGSTPFRYNLALLSEKFLGVKLEKSEVRENFGQFIGQPLSAIPQEFLEYGALDVIATYQIYFKLIEYISNHDVMGTLLSHSIQVKGDLALNHIRKNGIGFDLEMRDEWLVGKDKELAKLALFLGDWGLIRGVPGYKKTYKHIIENMLGLKIPYRYKKLLCRQLDSGGWIYGEDGRVDVKGRNIRVKEGETCHGDPNISSQRDDLEEYYDSHGFVKHFLDFQQIEKASSFVRDIESDRVHSRYNLLVNTGRTSCSKPNFQQLPKLGGVREMFTAPKGKTFIITDYAAVELATLSQVLYSQYGKSVMRDKINEGHDLHKYYGTIYYNKPIDKITKVERQTCKAPNFGFPGGLGAKTFIQFSKGYGLDLTETEAKSMKEAWFNAFPETREYMKDERGYVFTLTGRKRGNTTYCAEKNSPFQGLAADGAKLALYNLDREGFKVVGFVHDEIICEVADELAVRKVGEQERIMIESMKQVVPDVKIGVESAISPFYTK
jgi:DNA polymerase I-like protein with 3'-5' exonuclease and polymerase domains